MSNVNFELNLAGLNELMKSPEMQAHLSECASAIAGAAGNGYSSDVHVASFVGISNAFPAGRAYAETEEAKQDNLDKNTLTKAVGAVGLQIEGWKAR